MFLHKQTRAHTHIDTLSLPHAYTHIEVYISILFTHRIINLASSFVIQSVVADSKTPEYFGHCCARVCTFAPLCDVCVRVLVLVYLCVCVRA